MYHKNIYQPRTSPPDPFTVTYDYLAMQGQQTKSMGTALQLPEDSCANLLVSPVSQGRGLRRGGKMSEEEVRWICKHHRYCRQTQQPLSLAIYFSLCSSPSAGESVTSDSQAKPTPLGEGVGGSQFRAERLFAPDSLRKPLHRRSSRAEVLQRQSDTSPPLSQCALCFHFLCFLSFFLLAHLEQNHCISSGGAAVRPTQGLHV